MLLVAVVALPAGATAGKSSPCKRWGDAEPHKVATGASRKAVVCLLNNVRRRHGLPALDRNRKLQRAAQKHTQRMVRASCFAHECPGEPDLASRIRNVGYLAGRLSRWIVGENIAWGMGDRAKPRQIVDAWMHSPPHKAVILERDFREVGIGLTEKTPQGQDDGATFTADFGLRSN